MKKLVFTFFASILCSPLLFAAQYALISELGTSARMIGMGHVEGFSEDASGIFENPASSYKVNNYSISLFSTTLMNEVGYNSIAFGIKIPSGKLGIGYFDVGVRGIDETGVMANSPVDEYTSIGQFDYKNSVFKLSYQNSFSENWHWGIASSFYNQNYYKTSGSGYDLDFGIIYDSYHYSVSVTAKNFLPFSKIRYSQGSTEDIPFALVVSGAVPFRLNQLTGLTAYMQIKSINQSLLPSLGLGYKPSFIPFMEFLLGYNQNLNYVLEKKNKISLGMGINAKGASFYYAYERNDYALMDSNHYFSIQYSF
jgi:hypothetical protein